MQNWTNEDVAYCEFLITLSRLFEEEEDNRIYCNRWHITIYSLYAPLEDKYIESVGRPL